MKTSNEFGFVEDRKVIDVLNEEDFTFSAEVVPTRNGIQQEKVLNMVEELVGSGAKFLSVTKGAGGSLRGGSLPIAQTIKERFRVPSIAHFTCRDLAPQEIENQLMDHHYFGIRNILALRGDPPQDQPDWNPHDQAYPYAYKLIEQITQLNQGEFLDRPSDKKRALEREPTDFCIGAAVYPEHPDPKERVDFFRLKVEAGAHYGITQMVFDAEAYGEFLEASARENLDIPVLAGTLLLKSQKQALKMRDRFSVSIPDDIVKQLPEKWSPEEMNRCCDIFAGFVEKLKSYGAPGIHLFVLSEVVGSCKILQSLGKA